MALTDKINQDIKDAMRNKEREKLTALRDIKSKIMLEMTKDADSGEVNDEAVMKILNKLYKQRMDAANIYKEQNREDLLEEEMLQANVIKAYLPEPLSQDELEAIVAEIISQTGASSMADMGKVMGMASAKTAGRADGKVISQIVRAKLA